MMSSNIKCCGYANVSTSLHRVLVTSRISVSVVTTL